MTDTMSPGTPSKVAPPDEVAPVPAEPGAESPNTTPEKNAEPASETLPETPPRHEQETVQQTEDEGQDASPLPKPSPSPEGSKASPTRKHRSTSPRTPKGPADSEDKDLVYTRLYQQAVTHNQSREAQPPAPWTFHPQVNVKAKDKDKDKYAPASGDRKIWERLYDEAKKKKEEAEKAEKEKEKGEREGKPRPVTPTARGGKDQGTIFTKLYADALRSKEREAELKKKQDEGFAKFSFKPEIGPPATKETAEPAPGTTQKSIFDRLYKESILCKKDGAPAAAAAPAAGTAPLPAKRVPAETAQSIIERLHKTRCGNVKKGIAPTEVYSFRPGWPRRLPRRQTGLLLRKL